MPAPLGDMSAAAFLAEYWQKGPCVIRRGFAGVEFDFDGNDLAGLACEPLAEARIVSGSFPAHDWQLRHGPFAEDDFARLPDSGWTLLVQDVEKHYPPLQDLLDAFSFLPSWRLDDLMVSYAAPGGSVGPHVDQYDVFLLQVEGSRRWQIAERFSSELLDDCPLNVLRAFSPEREWVLEPGDLLYLPPGVAHHGVALTPGMTCSVGARAPDAADLFMALGESLAGDTVPRYTDPDLNPAERAGEIDQAALLRLNRLLSAPLRDPEAFNAFAGRFLTRFRLAQEPAPPDETLGASEVAERLRAGALLFRNPWTRLAWIEHKGRAQLFAAGETFHCPVELAQALCAHQQPDIAAENLADEERQILADLVNSGHFVLSKSTD